jgi:hypothetical protein
MYSRSTVATLALAAFALVPRALPAQSAFEGVVDYKMSAGGREVTMHYMVKGSKVRQEVEAPGMPGPMFMLMSENDQVMRTVMPSMGMYMETDLGEMTEGDSHKGGKVTKLDTSDEIAGVTCNNYRFGDDQDLEACIATGMGWFMGGRGRGLGPNRGMSAPDLSAYRHEFKDGMLPLRIRRLRNGNWETVMEATNVERKSLDADLFELPKGLRKMSRPGGD